MSYIKQIGTVRAPLTNHCAYCQRDGGDMALAVNDELYYYHRACFDRIERQIADGTRSLLLAVGKATESAK
jgi:hypothetical protein